MLSTCIVGSHELWYGKLGHVHYSYKKKIANIKLIPKILFRKL